MALVRFPLRRNLRYLRDMEYDLAKWQVYYREQSMGTNSLALAAKFEERAYILEQLRPIVHDMYHQLEQMPRLS